MVVVVLAGVFGAGFNTAPGVAQSCGATLPEETFDNPGTNAKELRETIFRAVDASPSLRNKKDLFEDFVDSVSVGGAIDEEWQSFVRVRRDAELDQIIASEGLNAEKAREFVASSFRDGAIQTTGTAITRVRPPVSRFTADGGHGEKKLRVLTSLGAFFDRYFGLG